MLSYIWSDPTISAKDPIPNSNINNPPMVSVVKEDFLSTPEPSSVLSRIYNLFLDLVNCIKNQMGYGAKPKQEPEPSVLESQGSKKEDLKTLQGRVTDQNKEDVRFVLKKAVEIAKPKEYAKLGALSKARFLYRASGKMHDLRKSEQNQRLREAKKTIELISYVLSSEDLKNEVRMIFDAYKGSVSNIMCLPGVRPAVTKNIGKVLSKKEDFALLCNAHNLDQASLRRKLENKEIVPLIEEILA